MRKEVWEKELKSLRGQGSPSTMIGICGATGVAKSSILDAILEDDIVPVNGSRACTSVVTEMSYHKEKTIYGEVSFLTEKEWRDELRVLLADVLDNDGNLNSKSTGPHGSAAVAWAKDITDLADADADSGPSSLDRGELANTESGGGGGDTTGGCSVRVAVQYAEQSKSANEMLTNLNLKRKEIELQPKKTAFCSLKRSEHSKDILKDDFRIGLQDMDDARLLQKYPDSFVDEHYASIDLPVFTCSARDYLRLKGQIRGYGSDTCFINVEDTGIPALQEWCLNLTMSSGSRAAWDFHTQLATLAQSIRVFLHGNTDGMMNGLADAVEDVRVALNKTLGELAQKVNEVSISVLWVAEDDDPQQIQARSEVLEVVSEILQQLELWEIAEAMA
ncbi:hypothetical protein C8Q80DRAFT_1268597 [Daedaleopsis nitida]|nr:hypothetical protein C8Q80DRAFT_1268597 [Daedaleopsis nitida]